MLVMNRALRFTSQHCNPEAAEDGSLERILAGKSKKEPKDELRQKAAGLLLQAAEDGSLERILAGKSKKAGERDRVQETIHCVIPCRIHFLSLGVYLEYVQEPKDELRQKAAGLLLQAVCCNCVRLILELRL
eukprot:Skav208353  [mRNA]  locus=scaffold1964:65739:67560:- [translate_table: standard]